MSSMEVLVLFAIIVIGFELSWIASYLDGIKKNLPKGPLDAGLNGNIELSVISDKLNEILIALKGDKIIAEKRKKNLLRLREELIDETIKDGKSKKEAIELADQLTPVNMEKYDTSFYDDLMDDIDNWHKYPIPEADKLMGVIKWLKNQKIKRNTNEKSPNSKNPLQS